MQKALSAPRLSLHKNNAQHFRSATETDRAPWNQHLSFSAYDCPWDGPRQSTAEPRRVFLAPSRGASGSSRFGVPYLMSW